MGAIACVTTTVVNKSYKVSESTALLLADVVGMGKVEWRRLVTFFSTPCHRQQLV